MARAIDECRNRMEFPLGIRIETYGGIVSSVENWLLVQGVYNRRRSTRLSRGVIALGVTVDIFATAARDRFPMKSDKLTLFGRNSVHQALRESFRLIGRA